jgi:hypothetical protein
MVKEPRLAALPIGQASPPEELALGTYLPQTHLAKLHAETARLH